MLFKRWDLHPDANKSPAPRFFTYRHCLSTLSTPHSSRWSLPLMQAKYISKCAVSKYLLSSMNSLISNLSLNRKKSFHVQSRKLRRTPFLKNLRQKISLPCLFKVRTGVMDNLIVLIIVKNLDGKSLLSRNNYSNCF